MTSSEDLPPELQDLVGQQVVVDTRGPFVFIGRLTALHPDSLELADADVHHRDDTVTSVDLYLIQALKHGVRANRRRVHVLAREVVSLSLLSDIIPY